MKFLAKLFSFIVICVVSAACLFVFFYARLTAPGPLPSTIDVVIPKGYGTNEIAEYLQEKNITNSALMFSIGVFLTQKHHRLQAGEYRFPAQISIQKAIELIVSGKTIIRKLTLPEGLTTKQITEIMMATEGLEGNMPSDIKEGSLLPETYYFSYGDTRRDLVQRMQDGLHNLLSQNWPLRDTSISIKSAQEAVILASIVERETALKDERSRIAAVFYNRLRVNMRLQSDPTVIYSISQNYGRMERALTLDDLKTQSPYNTYENAGLPPTPICHPGKDSILAVLKPLKTAELYFVASGTGGHIFATNLDDHNKNVAKWRKLQEAPPITSPTSTPPPPATPPSEEVSD